MNFRSVGGVEYKAVPAISTLNLCAGCAFDAINDVNALCALEDMVAAACSKNFRSDKRDIIWIKSDSPVTEQATDIGSGAEVADWMTHEGVTYVAKGTFALDGCKGCVFHDEAVMSSCQLVAADTPTRCVGRADGKSISWVKQPVHEVNRIFHRLVSADGSRSTAWSSHTTPVRLDGCVGVANGHPQREALLMSEAEFLNRFTTGESS